MDFFPSESAFDFLDTTTPSGQGSVGGDVGPNVTVWAGAGASTLLIVITMLILIKQNLDRVIQLCTHCSELCDRAQTMLNHLKRMVTVRNGDAPAVPLAAVVVQPRNLTDSELVAMRPPANGGQWI